MISCFYHHEINRTAYMVADMDTREAVVVDPARHIQPYLDYAATHELRILGALETHPATDMVSGAHQLATTVADCTLLVAAGAGYTYLERYPYAPLADGDSFEVGKLVFRVQTLAADAFALVGEGAVFVGAALTGAMPAALNGLPSDLRVHSSVGVTYCDTLPTLADWDAHRVAANPQYDDLKQTNLSGPHVLTERDHPDTLPPIVLRTAMENGAPVIDGRPREAYERRHLLNTHHIEPGTTFARAARELIAPDTVYYLIQDDPAPLVQQLKALGLDKLGGTFKSSTFSTIARTTKLPFGGTEH